MGIPHSRILFVSLALAAGLSLCACAAGPEPADGATSGARDPYESLNRQVFAFNRAVDNVTTKPLAKGYRKITPRIARRSVSNVLDNLTTPRSALNNFLQGKPGRGFNEIGRFVFNSTLGLGGTIDIAGYGGMPSYEEDFAQTFAVWGLADGPYLVLPFLGPQTLLTTIALPLDYYSDLRRHIPDGGTRDRLLGLSIIDTRYRLLPVDTLLDESNDPYITLRESFRQNREYEIYDGDPPVDDEYYEFLDEEEL